MVKPPENIPGNPGVEPKRLPLFGWKELLLLLLKREFVLLTGAPKILSLPVLFELLNNEPPLPFGVLLNKFLGPNLGDISIPPILIP
jgi:hypothetical protein